MNTDFQAIEACWVCDGRALSPIHDARIDFTGYRDQDPELAALTGSTVPIVRCPRCGFAQPGCLPTLPRYFDRMYDQHWSEDWVEQEHHATYKDLIFDGILRALERRLPITRRRLLDVGAHAGRFITRARARGWRADGLELNPRTAAFAARMSGGTVSRANLFTFDAGGAVFDAVTLTDVLEHIPQPRAALRRVHDLLAPGGWVAIKVPNGPAQVFKERVRGVVQRGYRPTLADNLVHVNHFDVRSMREALEREGFSRVSVGVGAPELPSGNSPAARGRRMIRRCAFRAAARVPGGVRTPLAFQLQAYACRQ